MSDRTMANRASTGPNMVEPLRLCLCSPHFPPTLSGVGDYTYFLATALADLGCAVEVLTSTAESDPALYPAHPGVCVYKVVQNWGVLGLPNLIRAIRELRSDTLVLQYAPHAYDRRGMTLGVNLLPAIIRSYISKQVMVNFHELHIPFDSSLKRSVGSVWQRSMASLIAACSNSLTANSSEWETGLRRVGIRKRVAVIPVGSNIPRVTVTTEEITRIRAGLLNGEDAVLVGCFGSTGPHRDAGLLREALTRVSKERSLKIIWIGQAGANEAWSNDGGIVWTGTLTHPEISRILSACDMFVLPFADGVSTRRGTLAAALLHELPIVTTKGRDDNGFFAHGENIYLVPTRDSPALARGLLEVAVTPELRARLARGAGELHRNYFAWDVIARQVADELRGIGT